MSDELVAVNGAVEPVPTASVVRPASATEAAPPRLPSNPNIHITIKRSQHDIEIDMDKLTWADGKQLRKYQSAITDGSMTEDEAIGLMDGIIEKVTGRHPDAMPMEVVNKIVAVLFAEDADAVAAEGN